LRAYLYREGMARFATQKYEEPTPANLREVFRHLTNYSLNKLNESFREEESKRKLSDLIRENAFRNFDALWEKIHHVVGSSLIAWLPELRSKYLVWWSRCTGRPFEEITDAGPEESLCAQLLGFDILVDADEKPWLLEVNNSPSLATECDVDLVIKEPVVSDFFSILRADFAALRQLRQQQKKEAEGDDDDDAEGAEEEDVAEAAAADVGGGDDVAEDTGFELVDTESLEEEEPFRLHADPDIVQRYVECAGRKEFSEGLGPSGFRKFVELTRGSALPSAESDLLFIQLTRGLSDRRIPIGMLIAALHQRGML